MQTLSNMRRNSLNQSNLKSIYFLIFLLIYDAFSSIYLWLPPLFGVLFLYFIILVRQKRYYTLAGLFIITSLMEISKGLNPGVLFLLYCFLFIFSYSAMLKTLSNKWVIEFIHIILIYGLYLIFNAFKEFIFDTNELILLPMIFYYIACECVIVVIRWILDIK